MRNPFDARLSSLVSAAALVSLAACASPPAGPTTDQGTSDLLNAPDDKGHKFDVGVCAGPLTGGATPDAGTCQQAETRCSGTLVAPNLVLTAQHCVRTISYPADGGFCDGSFTDTPLSDAPVRVTTSPSVLEGSPKWYKVAKVILPTERNSCADDLALLVLDQTVPLTEAFPAVMALGRDLSKSPPKVVADVGRGVTSEVLDLTTFELTTVADGLERRVLKNMPFVCAVDGTATCTVVDYSSPPTNSFDSPAGYFVIGAGTVSGDSGSGILEQAGNVILPVVLGVTSAGTFGSDGKPNFGLISRLDTHRDFLIKGLIQAAIHLGLPSTAYAKQAG